MQAHRLQTGGVEEGQVQTGAQFLLQNGIAKPHPLACQFKAGGGHHIGDGLLLQGSEDGSSLPQDPVGVLGLVAVHGVVPGPVAQNVRRPSDDFGKLRVIGRHEGGQQLRVDGDALPLVKGQDRDFLVPGQKHSIPLAQGEGQRSCELFRQTGEKLTAQKHLGLGDRHRLPGGDQVNVGGEGQRKAGVGSDIQFQMLYGLIRGVFDGDGADQRGTVLLHGVADDGQKLRIQLQGSGDGFHGRSLLLGGFVLFFSFYHISINATSVFLVDICPRRWYTLPESDIENPL